MKIRFLTTPAAILALSLAGTATAGELLFPQDVIIVQKVTSDRKMLEGDRQLLMSGNLLKIRDINETDPKEVIVDFGAKKIVVLLPKTKTYIEQTFEQLEKKIQEGWEGFRKLPNDQQQKFKSLAAAMPPATVERTQEFATIAGLKARRFDVMLDQKQEVWACPEFDLPPAYYDLQELLNPIQGPRGEALRTRMRKLHNSIGGFTLRQVVHAGRPGDPFTITTDTLEIRRNVKIPASEFEIPKGFKLETAPTSAASTSVTPAAMTVPMR